MNLQLTGSPVPVSLPPLSRQKINGYKVQAWQSSPDDVTPPALWNRLLLDEVAQRGVIRFMLLKAEYRDRFPRASATVS